MKGITHIFFDLDHTLWDYDFNSRKVLNDLYDHFDLAERLKCTFYGFLSTFYKVNALLWNRYNVKEIGREEIRNNRFSMVIRNCSGEDKDGFGLQLSEYFLYHCPRQPKIMEEADIALNYLERKYHMSIITNGFEDIQAVKLKSSGLDRYFSHIFTSEAIGSRKPDPEIFHHAISTLRTSRDCVIMIGDNPRTDILGARNAGVLPLLYNPAGTVKSDCELQISRLGELMKIL